MSESSCGLKMSPIGGIGEIVNCSKPFAMTLLGSSRLSRMYAGVARVAMPSSAGPTVLPWPLSV